MRKIVAKCGRCINCNAILNLTVHHLNEDRNDNRLDNLVVLCAFCHSKKHGGKLPTKVIGVDNNNVTIGSLFGYNFVFAKHKNGGTQEQT